MKRVILDTDVGTDVDDALALALIAASPELRVEGVTIVHADTLLRARIARMLLDLAGREHIPVIPGASMPLEYPLPERFHWVPRLWGHEGVGILPPDELVPSDDPDTHAETAAQFIIEKAAAYPGELSLITIGPLTNVARALQMEPRLADRILDLTTMGGMLDTSKTDWPPMLETNLNADPGAAKVVFDSGIPLTVVPIEVTTRVFLSPEQREEMRGWNRPLSGTLVALMEQMRESFSDFSQAIAVDDLFQGRTYMHDPLAIYASMAWHFTTFRRRHVRLEVHDSVLRTIAHPECEPNVRVCEDVDAPAFVRFWLERVERLVTSS